MHEIIWNIYLPCIHISVALYREDFLCYQFAGTLRQPPSDETWRLVLSSGAPKLIFRRSTGKTTLSPPENRPQCEHTGKKKNRKLSTVCIGIMSFMLPCYETSSWQIWVHGFRRWKSTNQQGAAVGISCTTILPWSCWGLWWHAVCEESALPKASFTDKDFYKRSLPPQKKPEDIASEFVSSKWHQRNKDCFQRANDQWFRYKKAKRDWCFFFEISLRFCMRKHDPLCDPRCGCDRPDESRSRSPRRCQWPRFHGFHLSGSPQEIEVHSMNSS